MPGTYPRFQITQPGTEIASEQKWKAQVLNSAGYGIWTDSGVGNVVIKGIQVGGSAQDGINLNGPNSVVRDCWIYDSSGNGVTAQLQPGTLLERNLIEDNGMGAGGGHGILVSGTNCTVRGNVIRPNPGWGCQLSYAPPASCADCSIYANLLVGNGSGLGVWSAAGQANFVLNNTIVSSTPCVLADNGNLRVTNNILLADSGATTIQTANGATLWADFNLSPGSPSSIRRQRALLPPHPYEI